MDARQLQALRDQAEACTGEVARERTIVEIECRYQGADHCVRVGEPGAAGGATVEAIFQLGRDQYTIHKRSNGSLEAPLVLRQKDVYTVTDLK
ncbi:MAG TPA: hypothetical protein VMB91_13065 [Solirubrobacteraceae bacterium]|nr:hypothetical protein [Solirubrobacteraceae bacterium]